MSGPTPGQVREAMLRALPDKTSLSGSEPELRFVYVPPSHVKALDMDRPLVLGGRGVGKSFWTACLRKNEIRTKALTRELPLLGDTTVALGYAEHSSIDHYPDMKTFDHLLSINSFDPYDVWRAVLVRALEHRIHRNERQVPRDDWKQTVRWVQENPETVARLMEEADKNLESLNRHFLLVFDALDRTSSEWQTMDRIVRGLLRVALQLISFDRLHGKVFLREDQFRGRLVTDFPDSSKITANRVDLKWYIEDLHGLLWQYLINAPDNHGQIMRSLYKDVVGREPKEDNGVWIIDRKLKSDKDLQRSLFGHLAGPWMGRNRRRGHTYTWIVGHLADSLGLASPRSFLAAVFAAAEDSQTRYPDHDYPLHYESIKRGVQKASEIRKEELSEDYPWVAKLLEPLAGMTVPCTAEEIIDKWSKTFGPQPLPELFKEKHLPPEHWEHGWPGILHDLDILGIFEGMKDGRVNMPDLYRVGFGLGRRGGVRPVLKQSSQQEG